MNASEIAQCFRRNVAPIPAAVFSQIDQSIVGTCPDHALRARRFCDGKDRSVKIGAAVVAGERTAGWSECRFVITCEVAADWRPAASFIGGLEENVCPGINRGRIVW